MQQSQMIGRAKACQFNKPSGQRIAHWPPPCSLKVFFMSAITPVKSLVATAKSETKAVTPQQAFDQLQAGTATLIDIRDIRELQREGEIDGAFHAPRGMLEFWADPQSPYHKEVFAQSGNLILFCASSWRSALAAKTLQDMGMTNIFDMDGGFNGWKSAGLPIETA
jgi:rhodanese-related sulfurtransferase